VSPGALGLLAVIAAVLLWAQVVQDRRRAARHDHPVDEPAVIPPPALPGPSAEPRVMYARFPRRLNALSLDCVVVVIFTVAVFAMMPPLHVVAPALPGVLLVLWYLAAVLYEPVQVAWFGGTIGHRALNLRVVDDATGANPRFWKAFLRTVCKALFGIFAFLTMGPSRRHRALHDILTGTTVQVRNPARAQPHHYVYELPASPRASGLEPPITRV
jgi:uncharacterized RDD family membrane protein YckC